MTTADIILSRLYNQQLSHHAFKKPEELVSWMGAVQAQDYSGAKWSIGLRLPLATDAEIEKLFSSKKIVRTWALRGTLHIISAADIWWLLELLGPVVITRNAAQFRRHELDELSFKKINTVITKSMQGGKQLTRKELFTILEQHKISTQDQRGSHILYRAALDKLICLGTISGKQETYTLIEEWIPRPTSIERDEALAKLAGHYFKSHGPATLQDFTWWSALSAADAKKGFEIIKSSLHQEKIGEHIYWFSSKIDVTKKTASKAIFISGYDEYFVGYKDRSIILDPKYKKLVEPGNGFSPVIVVDGQVKGIWRRTISKNKITIETTFFSSLHSDQKASVLMAAKEYAAFLEMPYELVGI